MGSEQSSGRRDREAGATAKDVERALEQQRRMYELKMQKLLEANRGATPSPSPSLSSIRISVAKEASAATHKDVEKALEEQRKMYDDKMNKLLEEMKRTANTSPPQQASYRPMATAALQQQVPNEFSERQRNSYSYNQNNLQSLSQGSTSLYPTLNQTCSPTGSQNYSPSMVYESGNANSPHLYQPGKATPQQYTQRNTLVQPSAPPRDYTMTNSRSRSQSRQRGGDNDVNCPTCGKMYGERIYQCNQGHSSCDLCKTRQVPCGQCRRQLTDRRNYDLEKYIMEKKVPCPNSTEGCRLYVKMANMAIHEKECPFNELQCPSLGYCAWRGKLSQLPAHFDGMHLLHNQGDVDKEMFLRNITINSHTMHYIRIGNFNFLFHVKVSERDARIYMATQLIGTKHSAAKWNYEIHIYNKSEPRRKYQYSDTCSSATEPFQDIVDSTKCAVIPHEYAKTFICGGTLAYKFYIKRDDKPNEVSNATEDEGEQKAVRRGPPRRNNFKKYVKKH